MTDRILVIVGAILAGAKAAVAARATGFDGRVVLVGDEHEVPYERRPGLRTARESDRLRRRLRCPREGLACSLVTRDPAKGSTFGRWKGGGGSLV
jgi:hypothetical protein